MNILIVLLLLITVTFGDRYSLCDCFDFTLAYGYPQTQQYGHKSQICYKFDITPNPSYQYECQYPLDSWLIDMYVIFT